MVEGNSEFDRIAFERIAETLLSEYLRIYYVDILTNEYRRFSANETEHSLELEKNGSDFFENVNRDMEIDIHEDDRDFMRESLKKENILNALKSGGITEFTYRLMIAGKPVYHVMKVIRSVSGETDFFVLGVLNIDKEMREKKNAKEMEAKLFRANRLARRDELTGMRNKNAYQELEEELDRKLRYGSMDGGVALVVCDMNDLKIINDKKGHTIGDDYLRKASFIICETFNHSPVFRVGGDEFVAVLMDRDYIDREYLVAKLKVESVKNGREGSGPVIACGMSECDFDNDTMISDVFKRADDEMYKDKEYLKSLRQRDGFYNMTEEHIPLPEDRKRALDNVFEAMLSISGGGYLYLLDIKYDYSRWSADTVRDFAMQNEYSYGAGAVWESHIHPDDMPTYRRALDGIFFDDTGVRQIHYRVCNRDGEYVRCFTRGFIICDETGEPDYFGGIVVPE